MILSFHSSLLENPENLARIFIFFHGFVWSSSAILTIIPLSLGILGLNGDPDNMSEVYWCWYVTFQFLFRLATFSYFRFKPGYGWWELGQVFYLRFSSNFHHRALVLYPVDWTMWILTGHFHIDFLSSEYVFGGCENRRRTR